VCENLPGVRSVPNPQRGRPSNSSVIIGPKALGVFYADYEWNPVLPSSFYTLTISFRQGKTYTWNGILPGQAATLFPARDMSTMFTVTDEPSVHRALTVFNSSARRTFLGRPSDSEASHTVTSSLTWNPNERIPTVLTLTNPGSTAITATVTAADGSTATGSVTLTTWRVQTQSLIPTTPAHTVFSTINTTSVGAWLVQAHFTGSGNYGDSDWQNNYTGTVALATSGTSPACLVTLSYPDTDVQIPTASFNNFQSVPFHSAPAGYLAPTTGHYNLQWTINPFSQPFTVNYTTPWVMLAAQF
jgi:hypothetical protein